MQLPSPTPSSPDLERSDRYQPMTKLARHSWDLDPKQARLLQSELAPLVDARTPLPMVRTVAGADISYDRGDDTLYAAVVVVDVESMRAIETVSLAMKVPFPYVPGLLSFREAPPILQAFDQLKTRPDVLITDGQGLAHPRRFGVACHLGLLLDLPSVGCGKTRLCGRFVEPAVERGAWSPLMDDDEVIGAVVRSRRGIKPLFVSVGHRADLASAIDLVIKLTPKYRVSVPIRMAHIEVNRIRLAAGGHPNPDSADDPSDLHNEL